MASILGLKTNKRSIPFRYLLHLLVQNHQGPLLCWWNTRQGVRRHNSWRTDAPEGLFELVREMCLFNWWSFLLVKSKTCGLRTTLLKLPDYQDFWIVRCQINRILLWNVYGGYCGVARNDSHSNTHITRFINVSNVIQWLWLSCQVWL